MFWDGIFHAFTWTITLTGIILMWNAAKRKDLNLSNHIFKGGLLAGWGIFNLLDSIFNHYIFRFHNVRENVPNPEAWNAGFLLIPLIMIGVGWFFIRQKKLRGVICPYFPISLIDLSRNT
jgi:uncharacterized membrane protein